MEIETKSFIPLKPRVSWAYEYVNDFVSINRKKKVGSNGHTVEVRLRPCAARLVDAARSGCDQMNLLTSVLVSRATRTHELSLFFNATVRC